MGKSAQNEITLDFLVLAREFTRFMREQVGAQLDVDTDTLGDCETVESRPNDSRMHKIAAFHRRPLALFSLPE